MQLTDQEIKDLSSILRILERKLPELEELSGHYQAELTMHRLQIKCLKEIIQKTQNKNQK